MFNFLYLVKSNPSIIEIGYQSTHISIYFNIKGLLAHAAVDAIAHVDTACIILHLASLILINIPPYKILLLTQRNFGNLFHCFLDQLLSIPSQMLLDNPLK
jgi:hypothetical protein